MMPCEANKWLRYNSMSINVTVVECAQYCSGVGQGRFKNTNIVENETQSSVFILF